MKPPGTYLLDESALSDPLLARLPALNTQWWRAGHRPRMVPEGYQEWLMDQKMDLTDPQLNEYLSKLELVTRGPIWSGERWGAIWGFLTGQYSHLVDREYYRLPVREFELDANAKSAQHLESWSWCPLQVNFPSLVKTNLILIRAFSGESLEVTFLRQREKVGQLTRYKPKHRDPAGELLFHFRVPESLQKDGFDGLYLRGSKFSNGLSVSSIRFRNE
jgi:hypothetical protein